jgi:hypothetical protein
MTTVDTERLSPCSKPLRDGSRCLACRVCDVAIECETVIDPAAVKAGFVDCERCAALIGEALASFLAEFGDYEATMLLASIYATSRAERAHMAKDDPILFPRGNA